MLDMFIQTNMRFVWGHFDRFESQASLHVPQQEGHEDVEALTDALEHDEVERDAEQGVEHAEDLASGRLRGTVPIS